MAHERMWAYRQEALLQNPREPPPAVRVAELLSWSQTDQAKRLIALAEMRRKHIETSSWETWAGRPWPFLGSFSGSAFWKPWMGYWALSILWLPFALTSIDAVRWASWVTLCLTVFGLLLPLLQFIGAPTLPFMSISTLWTSLLLYSLIAGSIWWNHLLGGARRWAVLSGQLAAQLVDQADAATGIAFLTRDWAEMARRSLAALDQVPTDAALLRTNRTIGSVVAIQDISSSLQITVPSNLVGYRRHKAEHAEFMPLKCCWGELRVAHSPRALPLRGRSSVAAGGRAFMSWRQHLMLSISASDAFPRPFQRPFEVKAGRPPTRA